MNTYGIENGGKYEVPTSSATYASELKGIEPTLSSAPNPSVTETSAGADYEVRVEGSKSTQRFWVERAGIGALEFKCSPSGTGGCPTDGNRKSG